MPAVVRRVLDAVAARFRGPQLSPEEHLRRHAERQEAQIEMRTGIERASKLFGRTNRFVR
jgi:hypothetical protein